jgi:hypothetical protein
MAMEGLSVRRIISRAALFASAIAAAALAGGFAGDGQPGDSPPVQDPKAEQGDSDSSEAEITRARDSLAGLLVSERIDRIDFVARTQDQGMEYIHAAVDTIIELNLADSRDAMVLANRASQVIEAFNSHKPRGLMLTFGKDLTRIPIRNPGDARSLGELVGKTVSLIRERFGENPVSYREEATKLFRSVVLSADEGSFLMQYMDGIQLIADQPPSKRDRYFR